MKVIVIHGTECTNQSAWMPWLCDSLKKIGIDCIIPNLPTPINQSYESWAEIIEKIAINSDDVVVGWSTGAIFAFRFLFENEIKVKKLILVSGFNNYVGNVPHVDEINKKFFMKSIENPNSVAGEIVCFKSDNDPFITQNALQTFAQSLNARIVEIAGGGHFNASSGFLKFEMLLNEILS